MSYEEYKKVILPTPDTFMCRGTNIFAQPPLDGGSGSSKNLILIPKQYFEMISRKDFSQINGYNIDMHELFEKSANDHLAFIASKDFRYAAVNRLDNGVDVEFIDVESSTLTDIVKAAMDKMGSPSSDLSGSSAALQGRLEVQAVLNPSKAELTLNGVRYHTPKYNDIEPDISDKFLVEVDNLVQPEIFKELVGLEKTERVKKRNTESKADDEKIDEELRHIYHQQEEYDEFRYIPVEDYMRVMDSKPIPNQFLVLTEFTGPDGSGEKKVRAYRLKYNLRRFDMLNLDDCIDAIGRIWKPKQPLHLRQLLALDVLLDEDVKLVYVIGGKQTGKTSLAMAAFESYVFGRAGSRSEYKGAIEEHITLIKSGLSKGVVKRDDLLAAYTSYVRAFSEQEFLIPFDELLKTQMERDPRYSEKAAVTKSTDSNDRFERLKGSVRLPTKAPFVLLSPREEQGMSYTGYTIRDECQNEFPHVMKEFFSRRGPGARFAVLGDLYDQINRPGLDKYWNGLLISLAKNIGKPHVAGIVLTECWAARL